MHLSGALYLGRNSEPAKRTDRTTPRPTSGKFSAVVVSEQQNASDGSNRHSRSQPGRAAQNSTPSDEIPPTRRHSSISRAPGPFVTVSLNDVLQNDEPRPSQLPSLRRESAPSKPPTLASRRKQSSPGITSVVGRIHRTGDSSEGASGITRTGSSSPRRSSLFSPDPALADDEDETTGPQCKASRGGSAAGRRAGTG